MVQEENLTFEDVNQHIESAKLENLSAFAAQDLSELSIDDIKQQICAAYKIIRPILKFILRFLPESWKKALEIFMQFMDALCPQNN